MRLIDIFEWSKFFHKKLDNICPESLHDSGYRHAMQDVDAWIAEHTIEAAPAVDAEEVFKHLHWVKEALEMAKQSLAPVVRCKDCKHMAVVGHGFRWCKAWERIQTKGDEGFCCFGERRAADDQA